MSRGFCHINHVNQLIVCTQPQSGRSFIMSETYIHILLSSIVFLMFCGTLESSIPAIACEKCREGEQTVGRTGCAFFCSLYGHCGNSIEFMHFNCTHNEPTYAFPVISWNGKVPDVASLSTIPDCNVTCLAPGSIPWGQQPVFFAKVSNWEPPNSIIISLESPEYYPVLKEAENRPHILGYATPLLSSNVPIVYNHIWTPIQQSRIAENAIPRILFLANNCHSKSDRERIVQALQKRGLVDSLGTCLRNKKPSFEDLKDKMALMKRYMFYAAFENSIHDDYVTEKFWGALESGTLPIYFGAGNIKSLAPTHSFIDVADFSNSDDLMVHIEVLIKNRSAYNSYHAWREKPLEERYTRKWSFTVTKSNQYFDISIINKALIK
eukprot:m.292098 g.292098  ORF g.292098 m.292098 type:complete len:380 (+) comp16385_c0_seq30:400-1539(+)